MRSCDHNLECAREQFVQVAVYREAGHVFPSRQGTTLRLRVLLSRVRVETVMERRTQRPADSVRRYRHRLRGCEDLRNCCSTENGAWAALAVALSSFCDECAVENMFNSENED